MNLRPSQKTMLLAALANIKKQALVMVSSVVKVFEEMMKRVSSAFRS